MGARKSPGRRRGQPGGLDAMDLAVLAVLLAAPVACAAKLSEEVPAFLLLVLAAAFSLFTFLAYGSDKRRAAHGEGRVPETTLHLLELLGGWPGAFLAQRWFRHKTVKLSYQFVFWAIVLLHEAAAVYLILG